MNEHREFVAWLREQTSYSSILLNEIDFDRHISSFVDIFVYDSTQEPIEVTTVVGGKLDAYTGQSVMKCLFAPVAVIGERVCHFDGGHLRSYGFFNVDQIDKVSESNQPIRKSLIRSLNSRSIELLNSEDASTCFSGMTQGDYHLLDRTSPVLFDVFFQWSD